MLSCLVIGLALVVTASHLREKFALKKLYQASEQRLNNYESSLRRLLNKLEHLPFIVAWNKDVEKLLKTPRNELYKKNVNRTLDEINWIAPAADLYLLDAEGAVVASSHSDDRWALVGSHLDFGSYLEKLTRHDRTRYFALGAGNGHPGFLIFHPVRRDSGLLGFAAIVVNLKPLQQDWVGSAENVMLTDASHTAFMTSRPDWNQPGLRDLAQAMQKHLNEGWQPQGVSIQRRFVPGRPNGAEGPWEVTIPETGPNGRIEKKSYLVQSRALSGPGWRLHIFSDLEAVRESSLNAGLLMASALLLATLLLLYLRQRRLSRRIRREARRALEASEAHKRAIIEGADAGLITMDGAGAIESFNPVAERLFGYGHGEVEGRRLAGLIDGECLPAYQRFIASAQPHVVQRSARRWEAVGVRKYGTLFPIDLTVSALPEAFEEAFIATINDISERKATEDELHKTRDELERRVRERTRELRQSNAQLRWEIRAREKTERELRATQAELVHAGKLAALGQMSSAIAHELNQPLTALRTFAASTRLLAEQARREEVLENLGLIRDLTERMQRVTDQLRGFARKEQAVLQPVQVKRSVARAVTFLRPRIQEQGVELVQELPDDEVLIRGEETGLERVLVNLIQNALDAVRSAPVKRIVLRLKEEEDALLIAVEDTGPGIRDEHLTQVFEPFFSTKQVGEGLGLGLALVYGIIKNFGGAIEGGNSTAGGAVFSIRFPIYKDIGQPEEAVWEHEIS